MVGGVSLGWDPPVVVLTETTRFLLSDKGPAQLLTFARLKWRQPRRGLEVDLGNTEEKENERCCCAFRLIRKQALNSPCIA